MIKRGVDLFFDAIDSDLYPCVGVDYIFGIQMLEVSVNIPSLLPVGALVFSVWQGMRHFKKINKESVTQALISGTLPQFFEKEALNLLNEMDPQGKTENYTSLLKKKGFDKIKWDTKIHQRFKEMAKKSSSDFNPEFSKPGAEFLDELYSEEALKTIPMQSRHEYRIGYFTVFYGYDRMNGYFFSVSDSRLEWREGESKEVNKITGMIGVGDGGGSYFDLHTGKRGFGFEATKETLATYLMRYGGPVFHAYSIRLGKKIE